MQGKAKRQILWSRAGSNRRPPRCERGALPAELLPPGDPRPGIAHRSVFLQPAGGFIEGLDEFVDMVFEDDQADALMAVVLAFVLRFHDVDEPGPAGLFFQVEKVSPLTAGQPLAVNFFRCDGCHLLSHFPPGQAPPGRPGNSSLANNTQISNKINNGTASITWVTTSGGVSRAARTRIPTTTRGLFLRKVR